MSKWKTNINVRIAILGKRASEIRSATTWSRTWWHQMIKKTNPTKRDAKLMGLLLATDWVSLLGDDQSKMMTEPPDWDYLSFLRDQSPSLGFSDRSVSVEDIPSWDEFFNSVKNRELS